MRAAFIAVLVTAVTGCEKADDPQSRSANPAVEAPRVAAPSAEPAAAVATPAAEKPGMTRVAAPPVKAAAKKSPAKRPPPPAEGRELDALAFNVPAGWTADQDDDGQWNFEANGVRARLNRAPENVPTTASGYLEYKIEWCWDPGTTADLVDNQSRPGGFGATMLVRDAENPDEPRLAYHAVWDVGGVRLRCEADRVPDEGVRDQIASLCGSARW